jgi:hypothetical protein
MCFEEFIYIVSQSAYEIDVIVNFRLIDKITKEQSLTLYLACRKGRQSCPGQSYFRTCAFNDYSILPPTEKSASEHMRC